jgi:hypothetical protein
MLDFRTNAQRRCSCWFAMIELESYMVPIPLLRKKADAARGRGSRSPRHAHAESAPNLLNKGFCRRLPKSRLPWLSLQRLLSRPGHTLAPQRTNDRPEGPSLTLADSRVRGESNMIQGPGDSGDSFNSAASIRIEQSQNPRYGTRCVASRSLRRGETIVRLSGALTRQSYRTIQIDKHRHLEEPQILAFLNHSCRPTVLVDTRRLSVFAATDIAAGEQLTFFYPSTEWEMVRPFICLCGSAQCLHYIAGARHLSLGTLDRYFINIHIRQLAMTSL